MKKTSKVVGLISFSLVCAGIAACASAQNPTPPGTGTGDWQITYEREGTDTYIFPQWDSNQNAYRMVTNTRDWKTNTWTLDGVTGQPAGFPEASWNTPTAYSGSAESKGDVTVKVKWTGTGTAPSYMFITLDSKATSGERSLIAGATCTGSNGQGDLFLYSMPTGESKGVHAKRLKLGVNGEAEYKISVNAKSTKTGTYADLIANTSTTAGLEPKAISLFLETYKRVRYVAGDHETVHTEPAWTGNIETEEAEIGTSTDFGVTIPVQRLGNWYRPDLNFTSSISKGYRVENQASGGLYPNVTIQSITCGGSYSLEQLVGMRTNPDTVTLSCNQTDQGDLIPGPFASTISMKVWAPERIISKLPDYYETPTPIKFLSGVDEYILPPGGSESFTVTQAQTVTYHATVTLSRGTNIGVNLLEFIDLGVKSDGSLGLGLDVSQSKTLSTTEVVATPINQPYTMRWTKVKIVKTYVLNRDLAGYGPEGFSGDFKDTVVNYQEPYLTVKLNHQIVLQP